MTAIDIQPIKQTKKLLREKGIWLVSRKALF